MASTSSVPSSDSSPLVDVTNSRSSRTFSDTSPMYRSPEPKRAIRRTQSFQIHRSRTDTSESSPSDEDSIYNAEIVQSTDDQDEKSGIDGDQSLWRLPPAAIPLPNAIEEAKESASPYTSPRQSSPLSPQSPPLGHSQWPLPQLDTILEQGTIHTVRASSSLPGLQSSPQRTPHLVQAQHSIHSIRPRRCRPPMQISQNSNVTEHPRHRRSFSLNDIGCLQPVEGSQRTETIRYPSYSSSSNALCDACLCEEFPKRPSVEPPVRSPTPPGLPSFGTKEALEYRLSTTPGPRRRNRFLPQWLIGSRDESNDGQISPDSNILASPSSASADHKINLSTGLLEHLRSIAGMPKLVKIAPRNVRDTPRAMLPPGITVANSPGVLAQADDGTFVRGRFSKRASGHGIGSRSLEAHPLGTRGHGNFIEEATQQIDKACRMNDRNERLQRQRPLPRFASLDGELRRPENIDEVLRLEREGEVANDRSRMTTNRTNPDVGSSIQPQFQTSSPPLRPLSPPSIRMCEPGSYPPSRPGEPSHADRMSLTRAQLEQMERSQARQLFMEKKRKEEERSCWNDFCTWFCYNCCDYDRGPRSTVDEQHHQGLQGRDDSARCQWSPGPMAAASASRAASARAARTTASLYSYRS